MEGCDSVITVHLIIKKSTYSSVDTAVCDRYRSPSGKIIESGGIYTDTLVNAVGCDSIITINLKVNHSSRTDLELSACDSVILDLTGVNYKWTSSGTFSDTIPASCGCDSIITANIHIDHVDPGVIIDRNVLVSLDRDAAYQWIDCDNGNTPVPGETYLAFTPDHSGRYAVIITQGACVDTSLAYSVIITGNGEVNNGNIQMYPNPTNGKVTIDLGKEYGEATITILNSTGIVIQERQMRNARKQEIILNEEGIYLVKVSVRDEQVILKVINQ
jgi:hypothetical protein